MLLSENFHRTGLFLFRWRSYLPLALFLVVFASLEHFHYPFASHAFDLAWECLCLAIGGLGVLLRVLTVGFAHGGTSGRGTKKPSAACLNVTGMYSLMRNPLYLGNFLMYAAPVLFMRLWWVLLIYVLAFALYYERIIFAEEAFLLEKFGAQYEEWCANTPAFFPKLHGWRRPALPFSWKKALTREYHGIYGLICALFMVEVLSDLYLNGKMTMDIFWAVTFIAGTIFYLAVRLAVKKTSLLKAF